MLLQIFGPREQVQRLQAAPGNAYHFAKLAHYAAAVTEQGLEDEAYFAPLADMEALPLSLTLTHPLTPILPLTLCLTLTLTRSRCLAAASRAAHPRAAAASAHSARRASPLRRSSSRWALG